MLENTACCDYWAFAIEQTRAEDKKKLKWSEELKDCKGKKYLCSECAKIKYDENGNNPIVVKGEWHNQFEKSYPTKEEIARLKKEGALVKI